MITTDRRTFLGATDVAAICGLHRWRTPYQVWAEKTGRLEPAPAGEAAETGLRLERAVLDWASSILGPLHAHQLGWPIDGTPICCHPDALTGDDEPVEAKTSGIVGPLWGEWGDDGTDDVPPGYVVQALVQIAAVGASVCHMPALLGGIGWRLYRIPSNPDLEARIIDYACRWWTEHVQHDTPPPGVPPLDVVKRLRRQPKSIVRLNSAELVREYQQAKTELAAAQDRLEYAQAQLLAALGDAEAAELPDGRMVTYYELHRREYTVPAGTYRVLRITKRRTSNGQD